MSNPVVCLLVTILCIPAVVTGRCMQETQSFDPVATQSTFTTAAATTTTTIAPSTTKTPSTTSTTTTAAQNPCNCNFKIQCCFGGNQCRLRPQVGYECGENYCPCVNSTCTYGECK